MLPARIDARSWTVVDVAGLIGRIREVAELPADGAPSPLARRCLS